jgi:hypothetical protein
MMMITAMMPNRIGKVMCEVYSTKLIKKPPEEGVLKLLI